MKLLSLLKKRMGFQKTALPPLRAGAKRKAKEKAEKVQCRRPVQTQERARAQAKEKEKRKAQGRGRAKERTSPFPKQYRGVEVVEEVDQEVEVVARPPLSVEKECEAGG